MPAHSLKLRSPICARLARWRGVRWLAVLMLTPALILGAFGGMSVLVHSHDSRGVHIHAATSPADGENRHLEFSAAAHERDHGHSHVGPSPVAGGPLLSSDSGESGRRHRTPVCVSISVPDHEPMLGRGDECLPAEHFAASFTAVCFAACAPLDPVRLSMAPGGLPDAAGPLDICGLRSSDRLVRTSRALLL